MRIVNVASTQLTGWRMVHKIDTPARPELLLGLESHTELWTAYKLLCLIDHKVHAGDLCHRRLHHEASDPKTSPKIDLTHGQPVRPSILQHARIRRDRYDHVCSRSPSVGWATAVRRLASPLKNDSSPTSLCRPSLGQILCVSSPQLT